MKQAQQQQKTWSDFRKWISNLLPLLIVAPIPAIAFTLEKQSNRQLALAFWISMPIVLWISINFLGLFQNRRMRAELEVKLRAVYPDFVGKAPFVGASRPKYGGGIHPHEDVGWLIVHPDAIEFLGETLRYSLAKSQIRRMRFAMNINSILVLGRWICVEGSRDEKRIVMRIEPRQKETMLGNFIYSRELIRQLRAWLRQQR